jgi:hypothetical protein
MIITGKHISRRTVLRGVGASIALPFLDAMVPAMASPAAVSASASPTRLGFAYIPNGVSYGEWLPKTTGTNFEFSRILKPLERHRERLLVLTGLDCHEGNSLGDGGGDHGRAGASYLTGVHPKKTSGADIQGGISADQIVANSVGQTTRLGSLELGCEDSRTVGNCDSGYSCAYTNSISWRSPTLPMAPETNPRIVFERLFGTEDLDLSDQERARRLEMKKSILDVVGERTQKLLGQLGAADRRKVDEQMTAIREIEKRIEIAEHDTRDFEPGIDKPTGIPVEFGEYAKLMFDLQIQAFQADLTRVTTLMLGREGSVRTYPEVGVNDPHHPTTHHRNLPEMIEKVSKINTYHTELYSYFLDKMAATEDGDGSLLDHSMMVYGGAISDGNSHSHETLPTLLFGRGGGTISPGRHIEYPAGTPIANLYLSLMDRMNVPVEHFGDATGRLELLSDLS